MQMPDEGSSSDVLLESYGEYHLAALGAEPQASNLVTEFSSRQQRLRTAMDARYAASRAAMGAEAIKARAEEDLENVIRQVELQLLAAVDKKRARDPYKRVFPENLMGALRPLGLAQVAEARRIAELIGPTTGTRLDGVPTTVEPLAAQLRKAADDLERTVAADAAAERAHQTAFGNELSERRRWREQYRKNQGLLLSLFPDNPRKVKTFFRTVTKAKRGNGTTAVPLPA